MFPSMATSLCRKEESAVSKEHCSTEENKYHSEKHEIDSVSSTEALVQEIDTISDDNSKFLISAFIFSLASWLTLRPKSIQNFLIL